MSQRKYKGSYLWRWEAGLTCFSAPLSLIWWTGVHQGTASLLVTGPPPRAAGPAVPRDCRCQQATCDCSVWCDLPNGQCPTRQQMSWPGGSADTSSPCSQGAGKEPPRSPSKAALSQRVCCAPTMAPTATLLPGVSSTLPSTPALVHRPLPPVFEDGAKVGPGSCRRAARAALRILCSLCAGAVLGRGR